MRSNKSDTRELETAHSAGTKLEPVSVTNWAFMQIGRALTHALTAANYVPRGQTESLEGIGQSTVLYCLNYFLLCIFIYLRYAIDTYIEKFI